MPYAPELDLRAMVGVPADASLEQLRAAYDLAMHRATRGGDHQHALSLSRAYDRLPGPVRQRMYPSSRVYAAGVGPSRPVGRGRPLGAGPRRRSGRRRRVSWLRVLAYGLLVPLAVGIGTYVGVHRADHQPQQHTSVSTTMIVPANAPRGPNGLVTIVCQLAPGGAGYSTTARPGAVVGCTNGATPTVVG